MTAPYLLSQLVVAGAECDAAAPAVRSADGELTYGELAERTGALAATLQALGVCRGDRVGVYLHKSVASFAGIHAVLRAGAAYVPIDPFAPVNLVAALVRDCGIEVVISEARLASQLTQVAQLGSGLRAVIGPAKSIHGLAVVPSDQLASATELVTPPSLSEDIAYVMYTSGSTGRPKGIVHTHRSGLSYARAAVQVYGVRPEDRLANSAPFHFDISTFELFAGPLARASTLVIAEPYLKMPASLSQLVADDRSTFWYSVPFLLRELVARGALETRDLSSLRWVLFGGEVMPPETIAALGAHLPNARFSNSYGPAEVNQCSFHHLDTAPGEGTVPIGLAMPDAELAVVDEAGLPCPPAQAGELLVRTATMMDRYWGRDDLTERAFRFTPLPGGGRARWYATGDLVRQRVDGVFEFIGRVDNQVKVRGNRVELESVESVLMAVSGIEHAVAGVVDYEGNQVLAAAIVPAEGADVDTAAALAVVAAQLPPYAVPFRLVVLDDVPFTPSGKLDRRTVREQLAERLSGASNSEERT